MIVALGASPAMAKGKGKSQRGGSKAHAADARAVGELAGKFKWGMSPEDCMKVIDAGIHAKYVDMLKKEQDVYKQDQLRKDEQDAVQKVKDSYVKFDGVSPGGKAWGTSIIQNEFAPRNDESMMTLWEKDQRRFLFFWHDRLYKQYIAFNAEHPVFAGKSFDDFAKLIQNRYGPAEMKFTQMRTKTDMKLDHLEWPASATSSSSPSTSRSSTATSASCSSTRATPSRSSGAQRAQHQAGARQRAHRRGHAAGEADRRPERQHRRQITGKTAK